MTKGGSGQRSEGSSSKQQTLSSYGMVHFTPRSATISMTPEKFTDSIVKMVLGGAPIRFFSEEGFQQANGELAQKMGVSTTRESVTKYVHEKAEKVKTAIREDVGNNRKLVYLKLDCCTRLNTNYLGVNIRYIDNDNKAVTRTLKVTDTFSRHTSRELREILTKILEEFQISYKQVVSVVTDNASNMVKLVKDINKGLEEEFSAENDSDDDEDTEPTGPQPNLTDSELEGLCLSLPCKVDHGRCGAHTLQLGVLDGTKGSFASTIVGRAHNLATEARKPLVREFIKSKTGLVAILENDTRWMSTYNMMARVLQLKDAIQEAALLNENLQLTDHQWSQIEELTNLLKKIYILTKQAQQEDLTAGYFFKKWNDLKLVLEDNGGLIAQNILKGLKKRETELFSSNAMVAAIYLDVSNPYRLTSEQKQTAQQKIIELALRLEGLHQEEEEDQAGDGEASDSPDTDSEDFDSADEYLKSLRKRSETANQDIYTESSSSELEMETSSERFHDPPDRVLQSGKKRSGQPAREQSAPKKAKEIRLRAKEICRDKILAALDAFTEKRASIKCKKRPLREVILSEYPVDLQPVALLLSALPPTQVSVERLFSALKFIRSDRRNRMGERLLNSILFLKANK